MPASVKRIGLALSEAEYAALEALARDRGQSIAATVKAAIAALRQAS